jgi:hypothetical protein
MGLWRAVETQVEAWRLQIEPWRVCIPLVADFHYFDEEQDPHQSKQSYPPIRIRIKSVNRDPDLHHSVSDPDSELFSSCLPVRFFIEPAVVVK